MYSKDKQTIVDRREMLKVKVRALAAEAHIIREMEKKTRGLLRVELHDHRVKSLRFEARASTLALGFIRGRSYSEMEQHAVIWTKQPQALQDKVAAMIKKYGPADFKMATDPSIERRARQAKGRALDAAHRAERAAWLAQGKRKAA